MTSVSPDAVPDIAQLADNFAALGALPRLRVIGLLLAVHPDGVTAGDMGAELHIAPSTLSHHLDRLRRDNLVTVRREGTFIRYTANTATIDGLITFLKESRQTRPR